MNAYGKLYETYEKYMIEADEMIRSSYAVGVKPEYEDVDILRGKLLAIRDITNNEFIGKKAKEKADELGYMVIEV